MQPVDDEDIVDAYLNVAVCQSDKTWQLARWEDLTDEVLAETHLVKADELLVGTGQTAPAGWTATEHTLGEVTLYRHDDAPASVPPELPRSGVRVMTALADQIDPNIVYCSQGLRAIDEEEPAKENSFIPAPRYQGIWAHGAKAIYGPVDAQPRARGTGRVIRIGIVDTGLAQGQFLSSWLQDFVAEQWITSVLDGDAPDIDNNEKIETPAGHGTFVAGVVAQAVQRVELHVARAVDRQGAVSDLDLARAIDRLVVDAGDNLDILNLSLGAWTHDNQQSRLVGDRIEALDADTLVVAAAGNLGRPRKFWPAAMPQVVSVGAVIRDGDAWARAEYSNYGDWVDAVAHDGGVRVPNAESEGYQVSSFYAGFAPFDGWAAWRGTSFTTPKVVGEIARVMLNAGDSQPINAHTAWERLRANSAAAPRDFLNAVLVETEPERASAA